MELPAIEYSDTTQKQCEVMWFDDMSSFHQGDMLLGNI